MTPAPGSLLPALRAATRTTSWGPVDDPVAQNVLETLARRPEVLDTLNGVLASHGLGTPQAPLTPLDGGVGSVVLATPERVVRLGLGPSLPRPAVPEVLPPLARGAVGAVRYEVLLRLVTTGISPATVQGLAAALARRGYAWTDAGPDNVGLHPHDSSRAWVLDPGGVDPLPGTPVLREPELTASPDDLQAVSEWLGCSPDTLVLHTGWMTAGAIAHQVAQARASYPQFPGDASRTRRVLRALRQGAPWRPVYVEQGDSSLFVLEGRHRMVAFAELGTLEIPVVYAARPPGGPVPPTGPRRFRPAPGPTALNACRSVPRRRVDAARIRPVVLR